MPRKNLSGVVSENALKEAPRINKDELSRIISSYITNKDLEKEYKDQASVENTRIKSIMEQLNITECESSDGLNLAKVSEQKKESFREDELIEHLKQNNVADDIVKTKEYIDYDALENAIYKETISSDIVTGMNAFKDIVVTKVLRISKNKKGDK